MIFGAGQMGTTIARVLLDRDIRVRLRRGPARSGRARSAEELPEARVFHARAFDPEFFERERIGRAHGRGVRAQRRLPATSSAPCWRKAHGVQLTIALAHDQSSV